ncbi:alpha-ketoglutarate-dependent dioxygenase AlkB [Pseudoxanthomonas broegbernensis]|uniref:Alpha-ketoglutarate-dependent dioxygenase AlkB n=1 Tax=Pseudoxanthomonas broegbernensis TaxID=83619 RepID=A0A7V8GM46_9GAMM|nr:alpha-ketoglutarate-dependent dioxygenase AlkB [Pseudoxanthomonas broegbernensis]KAF1686261.1 alpha-ketoglutarate-dependent dioxygenase AlkB [Pseudoxanthomonas broegbernensis]MBB6063938.1 alkylated DNA repair dioxygenase AlkB [Pseudoxanthomonas broegbernensis]
MDLFPHGPLRLVEDAEGGIRYWPDAVPAAGAQAWFDALRAHAGWELQRRPMYDRQVEVPRLLAAYRLDAPWPEALPLGEILERVQARVAAPYNAVGLNLYRDGRDSVAMHHDKLHTLVPGQPIALVSLGAPRRMNIRAKAGGRAQAVELAPGSVLAMSHASQLTHEHGIPKTARAVGERVSVVFRVRPARDLARGRHGPYWRASTAMEGR